VVEGDLVYVTSGYDVGCNLFKVTAAAGKFTSELVYTNKDVANHHGGMVKLGDHLYGHSNAKGLVCQNFKTGEIVWSEKEKVKKGSVSLADGRLYYREEESGNVILLEPAAAGYAERGRLAQPDRVKENAWPHPVIANGKLYLRDQDSLFCYDVKNK
jgi:outer membrane protein assembly factor BamB